jgi:hypothetical protein
MKLLEEEPENSRVLESQSRITTSSIFVSVE